MEAQEVVKEQQAKKSLLMNSVKEKPQEEAEVAAPKWGRRQQ